MSRFTAIEARATQSPASTNDVVWLVARIRQLRTALALMLAASPEHHPDAILALEALDEPNLPIR